MIVLPRVRDDEKPRFCSATLNLFPCRTAFQAAASVISSAGGDNTMTSATNFFFRNKKKGVEEEADLG